ncbi:Putative methyltransferase NSUN5 [Toxocara canis]|uniref:Putative methyltransferase NSUN5 n=1 Tax=Toxocara canis TaxID=6265 RepID=A0A0B2W089_TOXCA|nr:Putative methyltransferase NSUN5 [Toxocara canis]
MDSLYYESAAVVKRVLNKEKSIRSLVYASSYKNKKQLLRLCCETIRHRNFFDGLLECKHIRALLKNDALNDYCLLYVLLYEFLFGKGLHSVGKRLASPVLALTKVIHQQSQKLTEAGRGVKQDVNESGSEWVVPRYARVNTLKWSFEKAVKELEDNEWIVNKMEDGTNMEVYRRLVEDMQSNQVYIDPHVENLLIFRKDADLHDYWMITKGYLLLQDKASCLPALLLKLKPHSQAFDVCAAPGMKTSHLAALLSNTGKVWAMDRSPERVQTLRVMLQNAGVSNASILCGDFLCADVFDEKFAEVRYALVDPPCSGSGMVKRLDRFIDGSNNVNERRLRALSNLQAMILKHALKLPNLRRLVYSTCSIHTQENEAVIEEVLNDEHISEAFQLVHAMPSWTHRGDTKYEFASKCLRASPPTDLTNGFFVAVFKKRKRKTYS